MACLHLRHLFFLVLFVLLSVPVAEGEIIYTAELETKDCDKWYFCRAYLQLVSTGSGLTFRAGYRVFANGETSVSQSTRDRIMANTDKEYSRWAQELNKRTMCMLADPPMIAAKLKEVATQVAKTCFDVADEECNVSMAMEKCPAPSAWSIMSRLASPPNKAHAQSGSSTFSRRPGPGPSGSNQQPYKFKKGNRGYGNPHMVRRF